MLYELKCKSCGKHLLTYQPYERKYKSPLSVCKKCGQEYIDPRCQELAVTGIPEQEFQIPRYFIALIIGILIIWRGQYLLGTRMLNAPESMQWLLPCTFFMLGTVFVIAAIVECICIISGKKRKKFERLLRESQQRMSDPSYTEKLKQNGYL